MDGRDRTLVIVFASLHLDEKTAPTFVEDYRGILREISPSVICAELSPEQLDGSTTCHSKPEYAAAVLPVARDLGARVVPIQMPTAEAKEWERRFQKAYREYQETPEARLCLQYMSGVEEASLTRMLELLTKPGGIEYFQTPEYDALHVRPQFEALEQVLPELAKLYDEWNEYFLSRIEDALAESRGERVMIIAGGYHKYWLWDRLAKRQDLELHDLPSYRACQAEG